MKTTFLVVICTGILAATVMAADQPMQNERQPSQQPQQDLQNPSQQDQPQDQQQFQNQPRQSYQQDQQRNESRSEPQSSRQESYTDQTRGPNIDVQRIQRLTRMRGQFRNGVLTLTLTPQVSSVCIGGIRFDSPAAISSKIYFKNVGDKTMISGDLVLLQNQVNPVIDLALKNRLQVTALHSSFLFDSPRFMLMHINGTGDTEKLASAIGKIFDRIERGGGQASPMMREAGTRRHQGSAYFSERDSFYGSMDGSSLQDSDIDSQRSTKGRSSADKSDADMNGSMDNRWKDSSDSINGSSKGNSALDASRNGGSDAGNGSKDSTGATGSADDSAIDSSSSDKSSSGSTEGSSPGDSMNSGSDTESSGSTGTTDDSAKDGSSTEKPSSDANGSTHQDSSTEKPSPSWNSKSNDDVSIQHIDYDDQQSDLDSFRDRDSGMDTWESNRSSHQSALDQALEDSEYDAGTVTYESRPQSDRFSGSSSSADRGSRSGGVCGEYRSDESQAAGCPSDQSSYDRNEADRSCPPSEQDTSSAYRRTNTTSERGACPVGEARGFWSSRQQGQYDGAEEISPTDIDTTQTNLDRSALQNILRANPILERGALVFTFGKMTSVRGQSLDRSMGIASHVAFAGTRDKALVTGNLAVYENDLQSTLRALRQANINILSIANHLTSETPRLLFVHFIGIGRAEDLANGVRSALFARQSSPEETTPQYNRE